MKHLMNLTETGDNHPWYVNPDHIRSAYASSGGTVLCLTENDARSVNETLAQVAEEIGR